MLGFGASYIWDLAVMLDIIPTPMFQNIMSWAHYMLLEIFQIANEYQIRTYTCEAIKNIVMNFSTHAIGVSKNRLYSNNQNCIMYHMFRSCQSGWDIWHIDLDLLILLPWWRLLKLCQILLHAKLTLLMWIISPVWETHWKPDLMLQAVKCTLWSQTWIYIIHRGIM